MCAMNMKMKTDKNKWNRKILVLLLKTVKWDVIFWRLRQQRIWDHISHTEGIKDLPCRDKFSTLLYQNYHMNIVESFT